ncbi:MAG: hypothetical protein FWB88_03085 [Defluviitaleaceae bacterium]|nr:hypothetical protein [Defluviitaleaceae bacterium]MCL2238466.1 hypothetical protein [Defluviitaleaceae bacterium]
MEKLISIIKETIILYCVIFTIATIVNSAGWLWFGIATNPDVHEHIMLRAMIVLAIAVGVVIIKKVAFLGNMKHYIITCTIALVIMLVVIWVLSSGEGAHPDAFRDLTRSIVAPYAIIAAIIGIVRLKRIKRSKNKNIVAR